MLELPHKFSGVEVIRANQRYNTYKADYEGVPVFVKQVESAELAAGVRRELWGLGAFAQLAEANELGFAVPEVITSGYDYVATSWVAGKPMSFDPTNDSFENDVEFFAASLAKIDMITCLANAMPANFDTGCKDIKVSLDKLRARLDESAYATHFEPILIDQGFKYLYDNVHCLTARLTHADFTPANVLEHNGDRTLIDYESVNMLWPRFYDLVNLTYNRMVTKPELKSGSSRLIQRYFEYNNTVDIEAVTPQLNTIAMLRSLALIWEHLTEPNDYHNTQQVMTAELSERLTHGIGQILIDKPYFSAF